MTTVGIVTATLIGIALLVWVVDLVRQDRLYAGYGVIFVFGTLAAIVVLLVPPLLRLATAASVALLPVPSLSFVALVILTFLMVYVFIQLSVLSNGCRGPAALSSEWIAIGRFGSSMTRSMS